MSRNVCCTYTSFFIFRLLTTNTRYVYFLGNYVNYFYALRILFMYTKPVLYRSVHILMLLNKEYISLQCLVLHDSHQTWFQEYNGKNNKIPQILSSYYKALNRDFSDLIITLHLLGFDDAVLNLYSAYISLLSSYSIVPSSGLETHKDWACLTDHCWREQ